MSRQIDIAEQMKQKELFQRANMLLKKGDFSGAETICSGALKDYPDDANFLCLHGHALIRMKHFDDAKKRIDRALNLFPQFDRGFDARGDLLLAQGDLTGAENSYRLSLKINPRRQQTRIKLGQVLARSGQQKEVQVLKGEFFEANQSNKEIEKAVQLEKEEEFQQAEAIYRELLRREPDNVTAMRQWAGLGIKQKFYNEAEVLLKRAVEKAPDFSQAWIDLFTVQHEQEKFEDALESVNTLIKLEPEAVKPHVLLASIYASSGDHEYAIELYDKALEIAPGHVGALCGKGNSCRTMGDQEGAIAAFRASIDTNPLYAEPYWSLANLKTFKFEESEVDEMITLVKDERITSEGKVQLNNALGHEFHNRKDYDRAFQYLDQGNFLRREQEYYDPIDNEDLVSMAIETFTKDFFEENMGHGDPDASPIFIVGLPRSGSTLIEQILSSHSEVEGTHELRDLTLTVRTIPENRQRGLRYPKTVAQLKQKMFKKLGAEYIKRTRRHRSELPYFTDKNPNNFMHIGLLHLILPNAKIINARRHPLDSCFGSYKQLFASGQSFTYDLTELGEYYLQYQRLMDHWHDVMPGKVLDVQYEDVVTDTETQIRRIIDHCNLDFEESCLKFHETDRAVKTASSEQVRQPIYSSSLNTWRKYEHHLSELIEVLEPLLEKLPENDKPVSLGGSL